MVSTSEETMDNLNHFPLIFIETSHNINNTLAKFNTAADNVAS